MRIIILLALVVIPLNCFAQYNAILDIKVVGQDITYQLSTNSYRRIAYDLNKEPYRWDSLQMFKLVRITKLDTTSVWVYSSWKFTNTSLANCTANFVIDTVTNIAYVTIRYHKAFFIKIAKLDTIMVPEFETYAKPRPKNRDTELFIDSIKRAEDRVTIYPHPYIDEWHYQYWFKEIDCYLKNNTLFYKCLSDKFLFDFSYNLTDSVWNINHVKRFVYSKETNEIIDTLEVENPGFYLR